MANQKQRRRRAKEKRHDYELVYVDEDGVERPVEKEEEEPRRPVGRGSKGTVSKAQKSTPSAKGSARGGRTAQPPSWNKVLKRGAIFAPIFFATVYLLGGGKITYGAAFAQSMLLLAVFIPFSYFMDRVVWRQQQKRLNKR